MILKIALLSTRGAGARPARKRTRETEPNRTKLSVFSCCFFSCYRACCHRLVLCCCWRCCYSTKEFLTPLSSSASHAMNLEQKGAKIEIVKKMRPALPLQSRKITFHFEPHHTLRSLPPSIATKHKQSKQRFFVPSFFALHSTFSLTLTDNDTLTHVVLVAWQRWHRDTE